MHFSATIDYTADVETVATMLADPRYVARKAAATGALGSREEVVRDGEAFTVTSRLKMPTTMIPAKFRSLVGETIEVVLIEAWAAPAADGSRSSTFSLDIHGVPVRVSGTQHLAPSGAGTTETYHGDVKASIPLFGRPIEQAAVNTVEKVVDVERRVALEYLAAP